MHPGLMGTQVSGKAVKEVSACVKSAWISLRTWDVRWPWRANPCPVLLEIMVAVLDRRGHA